MKSRITISNRLRPSLLLRFLSPLTAFLILVSPGFAATPQPQAPQPQTQPATPSATCPAGGQCFADVLTGTTFYDYVNRIYQQDLVTGYPCGGLGEPCDAENRPYYRPAANVTRQQMAKFIDNARRLPDIHIEVPGGTAPIYSRNNTGSAIAAHSTSGQALTVQSQTGVGIYAQTGNSIAIAGFSTGGTSGIGVTGTAAGIGVLGTSSSGVNDNAGVKGISTSYANGVRGKSTDGIGVYGRSVDNSGVFGYSSTHVGISGSACVSCGGIAGEFNGRVQVWGDAQVTGNLSKGGGSFKIDHPLDPENKYLYHSFVESPDMMNVYNGNVTTDADGDATVTLPDWFQALNKDFRYQLTIIGEEFAQARIASKIKNNSFTIKTDKPNIEVSWQVTGIRQDPYANAHRIPVEEDKPADEQGKYLHPTEWGQPESSGINYERQQQIHESAQP
jgi:hypothetical protein